jgi:hypothetical protein
MFFVMGHFNSIHAETIYSENFENGLGDWDNGEGTWQVGKAESGPGACFEGNNCSATVLNGKYDAYKDSRFKSPSIRLPEIQGNEEIYLRFWHWFSYSSYDKAYVQIREYDDEAKQWNEWVTISDSIHQDSVVWSPLKLDLSSRAGKKIQFCLYHIAGRDSVGRSSESTGWYVDNIEINIYTPDINWRMKSFENGWEDFLSNRGIWEIGSPKSGPEQCYSGNNCAGTHLKGNYAAYTDSILISPVFKIPFLSVDQEAKIRFWHWFSYSSYDSGIIKIKIFDEKSKWSEWIEISGSITGNSSVWVRKTLDITNYSGKKAILGFFHNAGRDSVGRSSESSGWYIDEIEILPKETPECTFLLNPTKKAISNAGGEGQINITASKDNCQWSAISNNAWITIHSPASGSGNGVVSYSVEPNQTTQARTGTISIAGAVTFVIEQEGKSCHYTLSEQSINIDSNGGQFSVSVSTENDCQWSAISNDNWIIINSNSQEVGDGLVQFSVQENTDSEMRTGSMTIANQKFTVVQKGKAQCVYQLSENTKEIDESGGEFSVSVLATDECNWDATSNANWIHIKSGSSGKGDGTITYSVDKNQTTTQRTGSITVADQTLTINQSYLDCHYTLGEKTNQVDSAQGQYSVEVFSQNSCNWNVDTSAGWINILSGHSGIGNGVVTYNVSENTSSSSRTGIINIEQMQHTVIQASPYSASVVIDTVLSTSNIETQVCASNSSSTWIAIIAKDVNALDTYEIELVYDPDRLSFIQGMEDDPLRDIHNILKQNGGTTLGFHANEISPGVLNISNTLVGSNCEISGDGVLAVIAFKMNSMDSQEPANIYLTKASFLDCHGALNEIDNLFGAQLLPCSAAASVDTDISTYFYDDTVTSRAIESTRSVLINETVRIAVVVQGTSNFDTYQVEVNYDPSRVEYIRAYEDSPDLQNILKKYGGTTIGFSAHQRESGIINISNTLVGTDKDKAPDGTGIAAVLEFKMLPVNSNEATEIFLDNVEFINSDQETEVIHNLTAAHLLPNTCLKWDFNCDGIVNFKDLGIFADHWLFDCSHDDWDTKYDVVPDCTINFKDLGQLADHWLEEKECSSY